jgi:hypothetical protein
MMTMRPPDRLRPGFRRGRGFPICLFAALLLGLGGAHRVNSDPGADTLAAAPEDSADITASVSLPPPGQHETLPAVSRPFRPGESLKFSVQYGFIHAGNAWLEVPVLREYQGHPVFELVARAESNRFFDAFYKVRNRIESYWDAHGRFSRRYAENRREGHYRFKGEILFDPSRGEATYDNGQTFPIPPGVQDALSSFYYTRYQALPIGGSIVFDYHASRRSVPLQVRVVGRERIQVPAGTFDCVAIEPALKVGGIFKNNGRLVIWLTDDERRMPVLMKSKLTIGSISVVLVDARPGA